MLGELRQNWNTLYNSLSEIHASLREAAFRKGLVDIVFLAGSIVFRPLKGAKEGLAWLLTTRFLAKTLTEKLLDTAMKSLLKGWEKDLSAYTKDIVSKQGQDVGKKFVQEVTADEITSRMMQNYFDQGLRTGGFEGATMKLTDRMKNYEEIKKVVRDTYAKPAMDFLGDLHSFYSLTMDAMTANEQLQVLSQKEAYILGERVKAEALWNEAKRDMDNAKYALNECEKGDAYQHYLRYLAILKLPSQG